MSNILKLQMLAGNKGSVNLDNMLYSYDTFHSTISVTCEIGNENETNSPFQIE